MAGYSTVGFVVFKKLIIEGIERRLSDFSKYMDKREASSLEGCNPRSRRQWLCEFEKWSAIELEEENKHENERLKQRANRGS